MSDNQFLGNAASDQRGKIANSGTLPSSFQELIPVIRKVEQLLPLVICPSSSDKTAQAVSDIRSLLNIITISVPRLPNATQVHSTAHVLVQISIELIANVHLPGISQKVGAELVQAISNVAKYFPNDLGHYGLSLSYILDQVIDILSCCELSSALLLHAHKRMCYALQMFASVRLESFNFTPQSLATLPKLHSTVQRSTLKRQGNIISYPLSMSATSENIAQLPISSTKTSTLTTGENIAQLPIRSTKTSITATGENIAPLPIISTNTSISAAATSSMAVPQDASHNGSILVTLQNASQSINTFAMTQEDVQNGSSSWIPQSAVPDASNKNSDQLSSKRERPSAKRMHSGVGYKSKRTWSPVSSTQDMGMELTVMSYNILSQKLLTEHAFLYSKCNRQDLEWDARCAALCQEIKDHDCDIICVQEMEESEWMMDIFPFFSALDYIGIYKKRTGNKSDGCAILFKRSKFSLIKSVPVEYCKGGVLDRDNIGLIVVLQPNRPFYQGNVQRICVATTHLLFNPKRGDVKLAQLMLLLAELDKHATVDWASRQQSVSSSGYASSYDYKPDFAQTETLDLHPYYPTILCGDFNMEPLSELFRFIIEGQIQYNSCIARAIAGQREGQDTSSYLTYIPRDLLPKYLNITENCQYAKISHERHEQAQRSQGGDLPVQELNPSVLGIGQYVNRFSAPSQFPVQMSINTTPLSTETSCMSPNIPNITGQSSSVKEQLSGLIEQPITVIESSNGGESGQIDPKDQPTGSGGHLTYTLMTPISGNNSEKNAFNTGQAFHSFKFKSAYRHCIVNRCDVSEEVSSWHMKACCTLDYIFYSSGIILDDKADPSSKKDSMRENQEMKVKGHIDSDASPNKKRKGKGKKKRSKSYSNTKDTDNSSIGTGSGFESVTVIGLISESEGRHENESQSDCLKSQNQNNVSGRSEPPKSTEYHGSAHQNNLSGTSEPPKSLGYQERLQLLSNFSLFTYPDIMRRKPIPNAKYPSDHFCLIAKFLLR